MFMHTGQTEEVDMKVEGKEDMINITDTRSSQAWRSNEVLSGLDAFGLPFATAYPPVRDQWRP